MVLDGCTPQYDDSWTEQECIILVLLTSPYCVHSNIYGLGNIHWIRYLTAVDAILSTSSMVQKYHHFTSGPVKSSIRIAIGRNPSSIGKVPVPSARSTFTNVRVSTTSSEVSPAQKGIITNVLQGHDTVVLECFISEREPDITCNWECCFINYK